MKAMKHIKLSFQLKHLLKKFVGPEVVTVIMNMSKVSFCKDQISDCIVLCNFGL